MHSLIDNPLKDLARDTCSALVNALPSSKARLNVRETGTVLDIGGGIARISGLPGLRAEELVHFPGGVSGIASDLEPESAGIIMLGDSGMLSAGMRVTASGRVASIPVGQAVLGRTIDATGRALDGLGPLNCTEHRPIERAAPCVLDRAPVSIPLETGIKAIDSLIPIGRGQRELILGDRQTGKTAVAIEAILNQHDKNVVCIYCAIGQRGTAVARVVKTLKEHQAMSYTAVVVAPGNEAPGLQFITPYAATTIAEYFRDLGQDVLIVYDDLTRHARVYRELSLLLRRPPGREAYPGDIFYIHSRLLERSTRLGPKAGSGSLTALPIIETQAQDIAAFIPTNLISITDGQIYLSPGLFHKGHLPAIDIGRSVSRVGGSTQTDSFRAVASPLRLAYSQFEELQAFSRFATRLDTATKAALERGRRVRDVLMQREYQPVRAASQVAALKCVSSGLLDGLSSQNSLLVIDDIQTIMPEALPIISDRIESGETLTETDWQEILDMAIPCIARYSGNEHGNG